MILYIYISITGLIIRKLIKDSLVMINLPQSPCGTREKKNHISSINGGVHLFINHSFSNPVVYIKNLESMNFSCVPCQSIKNPNIYV